MKNLISIMGEINRIKELDRIQELPEAKYVYEQLVRNIIEDAPKEYRSLLNEYWDAKWNSNNGEGGF